MTPPRLVTALIMLLAAALSAAPVSAVLVGGPGASNLRIELGGPADLLANYTIGIYNRGAMTAGVDDPDFQLQALQADRVILLQEFGQPSQQTSFDLTLGGKADVGVFLLRNASLRDFSVGEHPYQPIFSTEGAPGSNLFSFDATENGTLFSLRLPGVGGGVLPAGFGLFGAGDPTLTINLINYGLIEPLLLNDMNPRSLDNAPVDQPVVPEPATIVMFGLGLAGAGMLRRFKSKSDPR